MAQPNFWADQEAAQRLIRERKALKAVVEPVGDFERRGRELSELLDLAAAENDEAVLADVERDLDAFEGEVEKFELRAMLRGEYDVRDAFLVIHAGAGGTEACDWVQMLLRMYQRWMERRGFEATIIDSQPGDAAGLKSVTVDVRGPYAYGYLKTEVGVHRLVRISPFDAQARRHTSFASVDVVPQFTDEDTAVEVKEEDLKIDRFCAGGPGGQHVNKTASAIRITHLPTGIIVSCQNERSQHQNRAVAMHILQARIYARRQEEHQAEVAALRGEKLEVSFGSQRRNYVLQPYTLAKDTVTGVETGDVNKVLDGDLDPFVEAYLRKKLTDASAAAAKG